MRNKQIKQCSIIACLSVAIAFSMFVGNLMAADLFVSASTGSDAAAGTSAAPFKTLFRAKQEVRTLPKTGPITVTVKAGTYYFDSSLVFAPADGGSATAPITYKAATGEKVILSGGIKVTSAWTVSSGNIMVTTIAKNLSCDQLFLNGARQVLARYPNYNANTVILNGYAAASDVQSASRVSKWANPTEGPGYIRGLHQMEWGGWSDIITGKSSSNTLTLKWVGDNNRTDGGYTLSPNWQLVENIFEELDAPGEWYYSKTTGNLYFYPPTGTTLSSANIELASVEELIKVVGTSNTTPTAYLTFDGFSLTETGRTLFTRTYERLLAGDWAIARAGTVFLQNAENVTVQNCTFDQVGGNGVFISGYNKNHLIFNNNFTDAGASCVAVVGLTSAVRSPSYWPSSFVTTMPDPAVGPKTEDYPRSCTISNNKMYNMGRFEKQVCGVCLSMSKSISILHNSISYSPRSGINVNDGCWGGHDIGYNDISNCVRESGDHGPYNAWGRDRFWSFGGFNTQGKNGAAKRPYALLDAMAINQIHNNRVTDSSPSKGGYGIDLDDGSTNYRIFKNLCQNCGIKLREGFDRKVYNNIIIGNQIHCHVWYASCCDSVSKNIIVNGTPYEWIGVSSSTISSNQAFFDNNLFWNNGSSMSANPLSGQEAHSKTNVDPMFTNAANKDYSLKAGSPALALGFVSFPMDSFGQINGLPGSKVIAPASSNYSARSIAQSVVKGSLITTRFWLDKDAQVSLSLCALDGRKIANIAKRSEIAGSHEIVWNGFLSGNLPRNCYVVMITVDGQMNSQKIVIMK